MGFVDASGPSGFRTAGSVFYLLVVFGILVIVLVNGPLAPFLARTRGVAERMKVPTFIMAEDVLARTVDDVLVRTNESFEIPCRLGARDPSNPNRWHDMHGSYRLDFSSSAGDTWTSHGSAWTEDGIAIHRGVVGPGPVPCNRVIRIDFTGTDVWGASTKFVFMTVHPPR